jgi:hypothetical protein
MSRLEIEPGPEASILAKSYSNTMLIAIRNIYTFNFVIFFGSVSHIYRSHDRLKKFTKNLWDVSYVVYFVFLTFFSSVAK